MIQNIDFHIKELDTMKKYPKELFYIGDLELLKKRKVSIVGTRKPNQYTKQQIYTLAKSVITKNKLNSTIKKLIGF